MDEINVEIGGQLNTDNGVELSAASGGEAVAKVSGDSLIEAVKNCDIEDVQALLQAGADVNYKNWIQKSPLYLALESGSLQLVQLLLNYGADVNVESYCNMYCMFESPIVTSARLNRRDFVELILDHGCELEGTCCSTREGRSALQWGANHGDILMTELLLLRGADINWIGPYQHTALHFATTTEKPEMVKWLLENGANVTVDGERRLPLHNAAVRGSIAIVKCLVEKKCPVNVVDSFGFTPLSLAALRGHLPVVQYLLENCAEEHRLDIDDALQKASESGHLDVMRDLLERGADVNYCGKSGGGETALFLAAKGQLLATVELLKSGAKMNVTDDQGYTPLHCALLRDHMDIARALIQHGASVSGQYSIADAYADSPLQIAYATCNVTMVKCIIEAGCPLHNERWLNADAVLSKIKDLDFQTAGPIRFRLHHNIAKYRDIWEWVLQRLANAPPMAQLCRNAIRHRLLAASQGRSILALIDTLPLPASLQRYLKLEEI